MDVLARLAAAGEEPLACPKVRFSLVCAHWERWSVGPITAGVVNETTLLIALAPKPG